MKNIRSGTYNLYTYKRNFELLIHYSEMEFEYKLKN